MSSFLSCTITLVTLLFIHGITCSSFLSSSYHLTIPDLFIPSSLFLDSTHVPYSSKAAFDFPSEPKVWKIREILAMGLFTNSTTIPNVSNITLIVYNNSMAINSRLYAGLNFTFIQSGGLFNLSFDRPLIINGGPQWVSLQPHLSFDTDGQWNWNQSSAIIGQNDRWINPGNVTQRCVLDGTWQHSDLPGCNSSFAASVAYEVVGDVYSSLGTTCSSSSECYSGFCVDGVCCDGACAGKCVGCNSLGHCVPIAQSGVTREPCENAGTTCGGYCSPTDTTVCSFPSDETVCGRSCSSETQTQLDMWCQAAQCVVRKNISCNGYSCNQTASACLSTCSSSSECQGSYICESGACIPPPTTSRPTTTSLTSPPATSTSPADTTTTKQATTTVNSGATATTSTAASGPTATTTSRATTALGPTSTIATATTTSKATSTVVAAAGPTATISTSSASATTSSKLPTTTTGGAAAGPTATLSTTTTRVPTGAIASGPLSTVSTGVTSSTATTAKGSTSSTAATTAVTTSKGATTTSIGPNRPFIVRVTSLLRGDYDQLDTVLFSTTLKQLISTPAQIEVTKHRNTIRAVEEFTLIAIFTYASTPTDPQALLDESTRASNATASALTYTVLQAIAENISTTPPEEQKQDDGIESTSLAIGIGVGIGIPLVAVVVLVVMRLKKMKIINGPIRLRIVKVNK